MRQANKSWMSPWKSMILLAVATIGIASLTGCEEEESNDLAKAQACLDKISNTNYNDASLCMDKIAKYDSQQANILKCSILMVDGGLTTGKVTEAYKSLSTSTTTKEAAFIAVLAMSPVSKATDALPYCEKTGLKGFIYLANLAVMGSQLASLLPPGGYDPTDPTSIPTDSEVEDMITACTPPSGTCDYAAIGASVETLGSTYCTGSNATSDVCVEVLASITANPGNPTNITKNLMCKYDPAGAKTYDSNTDSCI